MTFGDAMRSKARLSVTGSTGENGRVMTPEFPKAVHSVPYVRPDMGLNVSLTDLSWSLRNFWVPYTGFNRVFFFFFFFYFPPFLRTSVPAFFLFVWCLVIKTVEDGGFILSNTKTRIVTLCLYYSPYETPPSMGGITFWTTKGRLSFSKLVIPRFPVCADCNEKETRAWLTASGESQ